MPLKIIDHLSNVRRKFSRSLPNPDLDEITRISRERDSQINMDTAPPDDEFVDLYCVWGLEFYSLESIDNLAQSFRKLGWEEDVGSHSSDRDPVAWIHRLNRHPRGGSWMNLGILVPRDSNSFTVAPNRHTVPLPTGVKYALAGIHDISPSLVSIAICFVLDGEYSVKFDEALRTSRQTYTTPTLRGHSFHLPNNQKTNHINQIRTEMSELASEWFSQNLPGLFSSGFLDGEVPTCELVTLRQAEPFPCRSKGVVGGREYLSILDLRNDWDAWRSTQTTGLKFKITSEREGRLQYHSTLAIRVNNLVDIDLNRGSAGASRESQIYSLNLSVPYLLNLWAIVPLLESYTREISKVRESARLTRNRLRDSIKILESVEDNLSFCSDVAMVASELSEGSREPAPFGLMVQQFKVCSPRPGQERLTLTSALSSAISERSTQLQRATQAMRDQLMQYGALLGASENVRVQKKISHLTWLLIVLAIVTLMVPYLAPSVSPWLQNTVLDIKRLWPW